MDASYYVYLHRRNDTNEVFYVGKGKKHRAKSKSYRNKWWHNVVNKYGYTIEFVETGLTNSDAATLEMELIKFYRECGHALCNLTDGGEGCAGRVLSEESKAKMSRAKIGKKASYETKLKMSAAKRGVPKSEEHVAKVAVACRKAVKCSNGKEFVSITEASAWVISIGLSKNPTSSIVACCRGRQDTAYGFKWSYL